MAFIVLQVFSSKFCAAEAMAKIKNMENYCNLIGQLMWGTHRFQREIDNVQRNPINGNVPKVCK